MSTLHPKEDGSETEPPQVLFVSISVVKKVTIFNLSGAAKD